jgi:fluoride ion exporter CrcB/FEX
MLAILVEAVIGLLQRRRPSLPGSAAARQHGLECSALQGVLDGFCGSLSTVSTFVVELRTLRRRDAYVYGVTSWVVGQVLMVLVLGSWIWSGDRSEGVCVA